MVAGLGYASYTVLAKRMIDAGAAPERVMSAAFGRGALILLPVPLVAGLGWLGSPEGVALALYLGAVPTALAYFLFARGLRSLSAGETATLTLAEPLTAVLLGALVLGERPGAVAIAGAALVLAGLLVLAAPRGRAAPAGGRGGGGPGVTAVRRAPGGFAVEELTTTLRTRILDGDPAPGTRLVERELVEAHGVARHTLRAALRALAAEGLVEIVPNRGARVAAIGRDQLVGLFDVRTALEVEACRLALARDPERLRGALRAAAADLRAVCEAPGSGLERRGRGPRPRAHGAGGQRRQPPAGRRLRRPGRRDAPVPDGHAPGLDPGTDGRPPRRAGRRPPGAGRGRAQGPSGGRPPERVRGRLTRDLPDCAIPGPGYTGAPMDSFARRAFASVLAVAAIAVPVAGCGGDSESGDSGKNPLDNALGYVPENTPFVAVIETDPSSAQFKNATAIAKKFPFAGQLQQQLERGLSSSGNTSYEKDIKPLLGNEFVVGATDPKTFVDSGSTEDEAFIAAIQVKDGKKLTSAIEKGKPKELGEKDGAKLYQDDDSFAAVKDDVLVVANSRRELEAGLTRRGKDERFGEDDFNKGTEGLPESAVVRTYFNLKQLIASDPDTKDAQKVKWVKALESFGLSASTGTDKIDIDFNMGTDSEGLSDADLPLAAGDESPEVAERAGEFGFGLRGIDQIFKFAESSAQAVNPSRLRLLRDGQGHDREAAQAGPREGRVRAAER